MKTCTKCQGTFEWKQPYDKTKIPSGDKPCTCGTFTITDKKITTVTIKEVPIEQICDEIIAIQGTFIRKSASNNKPIEETKFGFSEAMIEGIWKFAISRKMSR